MTAATFRLVVLFVEKPFHPDWAGQRGLDRFRIDVQVPGLLAGHVGRAFLVD